MELLRTRNIKTDSELESQTSRFLPILNFNHHIGGQFHTRPALREWLTCGYPISHQATPAASNQRRIWDLHSLPVDTTWGASKRLFTVESGSLTGGLWLDGGIGEFPADGLKAKHLGSAWTVVITIATKKKKQTPHYLVDAHRPLRESPGYFPYVWCVSCLGCFRTTSGSYISPLSTDKLFVGQNVLGEMDNEKYLPELMAEKDSLDSSFQHSLRLLDQGKSRYLLSNYSDTPLQFFCSMLRVCFARPLVERLSKETMMIRLFCCPIVDQFSYCIQFQHTINACMCIVASRINKKYFYFI